MIRVGVLGAGGRMGATVCAAVVADPDLELVAAVDPQAAGRPLREAADVDADLRVTHDVTSLSSAEVDVVVDFTVADASRANLPVVASAGIHAVVGTTGLTDADLDQLRLAFTSSNCLVSANFAVSAVLMMRFAELAAPFFDTVEILEYHHDRKVDAPSGTAIVTAERIAASSDSWAPDPTEREVVARARGAEVAPGVRVHSVRMRGMVAHQEVLLGAEGQSLTLRQDSYDRTSFMPGVLLACKRIGELPGVTMGLDTVLGL